MNTAKPTLYFFKLRFRSGVCPACSRFEEQIFSKAVKDPQIRDLVNLQKITFGQTAEGKDLQLDVDYPDFHRVTFAPYIWLGAAYDPSKKGYHLNPETYDNPKLNTRQNGHQYQYYGDESTYEDFRNWVLSHARSI